METGCLIRWNTLSYFFFLSFSIFFHTVIIIFISKNIYMLFIFCLALHGSRIVNLNQWLPWISVSMTGFQRKHQHPMGTQFKTFLCLPGYHLFVKFYPNQVVQSPAFISSQSRKKQNLYVLDISVFLGKEHKIIL